MLGLTGGMKLFTGSSDSRQPLRVCKLSTIDLLLHTSIIVKNKNIILYFYEYVFLVVHQGTAAVYNTTSFRLLVTFVILLNLKHKKVI